MFVRMIPSLRTTTAVRSSSIRCFSSQFYSPTLTEKREGEAGRGGRASEASVKVALFGASGFLGKYVSAELGKSEGSVYSSLLVS